MLLKYQRIFEKTKVPQIGDLVICIGDIDGLKTHNHIGFLKEEGVQFLRRWSDKLHDLDGKINNNNGWFIKNLDWVKPFYKKESPNNIPLIYSSKFKDVISYSLKFLMDYENIYHCDVSYISTTNRNDTVSFLTSSDYRRLEPNENPWESTMRQNIRFGRFLKKIVNDVDKVIEDYVNEYKFSYNIDKDNLGRFKVATGFDMAKWYLENYYVPGGGTLNGSCMRHIKSQRRLPIYTTNPDKIKMLYLLNPIGKLLGRALIWKLDVPKGIIYMDRIYYVEDFIEKLFLDYAKRKGMLTKYEAEKSEITLKVDLKKDYGPPQNNPFMDTFKFFIRGENYLTNKFKYFKAGEYWEYIDHD
jgi:hypothetical protein